MWRTGGVIRHEEGATHCGRMRCSTPLTVFPIQMLCLLQEQVESPVAGERTFVDDDGTAYEWDSNQRRFVEMGSQAAAPGYGVEDMTYAVEADVIPPIPEVPKVFSCPTAHLMWVSYWFACRSQGLAGVWRPHICGLQDDDDDDDGAAGAEGKKRPGADKHKLADAFEREKIKAQRSKEDADKKVHL